jgi:hypothetical protein
MSNQFKFICPIQNLINSSKGIEQGVLISDKGPKAFLWAGSQAACPKFTISVIPNLVNYCTIVKVHILFTKVARVRSTLCRM